MAYWRCAADGSKSKRAHKMLAWHVAKERIDYRRAATSIAMLGARGVGERAASRSVVSGIERLRPCCELLIESRAL
jgi:hypothetical protein